MPSKATTSVVLGTPPTALAGPPEDVAQFVEIFQLEEDDAIQYLLAAVAVFETHNKKETHSVRIKGLMILVAAVNLCSKRFFYK